MGPVPVGPERAGPVPVGPVPEGPERAVPGLEAPGPVVQEREVNRASRDQDRGRRPLPIVGILVGRKDRRKLSRIESKVAKSAPAVGAVGSRMIRNQSRTASSQPGSAAAADGQIRISLIPAIGPMENAVLSVPARDARILIAQLPGRRARTKLILGQRVRKQAISALPMVAVPVPENPIPTVRAGLPRDGPAHQWGEIPGATERIRSDRHIRGARAAVDLELLARE